MMKMRFCEDCDFNRIYLEKIGELVKDSSQKLSCAPLLNKSNTAAGIIESFVSPAAL